MHILLTYFPFLQSVHSQKVPELIYSSIQQDSQCTYKLNTKVSSQNHCCCGKEINITYFQSVFVALVIQHTICMYHIILSSVASLTLTCFSTRSHQQHSFWKKVTEYKMCFWFSLKLLSKTFLTLRIQQDTIKNICRSSCKVSVILVRFW
jgi:hypothetical protein